MTGSVTLLCGPQLGALTQLVAAELEATWTAVRRGRSLLSDEDAAATYTKGLLRCMVRAGLGKHAVVWLPDAGPELGVHQRRSLERVAQGLRPVALVEVGGGAYPRWLRALGGALPVHPLTDHRAGSGPALEGALRLIPAPSVSSKNTARTALEERLTASRPVNPGAGTGSWRPGGVLLVGDRPNARRWRSNGGLDVAASWPFVSQVPGGCSAWLSEQLEGVGIPETMLYWVNAFRANGEATCDLFELAAKLRPQLAVALGGNAAELLKDCGVVCEQVHHPQHWKRFHFDERYRLPQLLGRLKTRAA